MLPVDATAGTTVHAAGTTVHAAGTMVHAAGTTVSINFIHARFATNDKMDEIEIFVLWGCLCYGDVCRFVAQ